jgi:molecular chaperone GrpE
MPAGPRSQGSGEGAVERPETESLSPTPSPAPVSGETPDPLQDEKDVERDLAELLSDVSRERDEYLDLAQRTKADFENYRKRVAREAQQAEARGRGSLASRLVPVLDNLERALEHSDAGSAASLAEGVRLVYEELAGVLRSAGVETYSPAGEAFDPVWHEAVMTRPGEEGQVLEVLEKGYRLDGTVLRPARVIVGAEEAAPGE